jgi:hypothetical protein
MPDCSMAYAIRRYAADCAGKEAFVDPGLARRVMVRMRRRKHRPVTTYRCPHCGQWHIGTGEGRGR